MIKRRHTNTMTAATQAYLSPAGLDPNKIFFAGFGIEGDNNHLVRNCAKDANTMVNQSRGTLHQHVDTQQQQRSNDDARNSAAEDISSFFDFEPQTNPGSPFPPPFPLTITPAMASGWNNMPFGSLSPPDSAIFAPEEWPPYQIQPRQPSNIITNVYPEDTRIQYGQATPPDDDGSSMFEYEHKRPRQAQPASVSSTVGAKKRKRSSTTTIKPISPTKRTRKNTRSNTLEPSNAQSDPNNPEDVRRSKFLERNRVAASKCRQKKKEWTSNLETRARDLQKNNGSLRLMLGSLKDEVLFLKGEMLKHTSCCCEQIQSFLKQRASDFSEQHEDVMKEQSPVRSAPTSRHGSFSTVSDRGTVDDAAFPTVHGSPTSIPPEDNDLEALLTAQFVHDTSDQCIARQGRAIE